MASAKARKSLHEKETKDGVSVDWIILTASVSGLLVVALASVQAGGDGLAAYMGSYLISSN